MKATIYKLLKNLGISALLFLCFSKDFSHSRTIRFTAPQIWSQVPLGKAFFLSFYREAFRRLGYDFEVTFLPAKRAIIEFDRGLFDGDIARSRYLEQVYSNAVRVNFPLVNPPVTLLSKQKLNKQELADKLRGKSVAVARGLVVLDAFTKKFDAQKIAVGNFMVAQQMVVLDRSDFALWLGPLDISPHKELHQLDYYDQEYQLYPFMHKEHRALAKKLEVTLYQMQEESFFVTLAKKFGRKIMNRYRHLLMSSEKILSDEHLDLEVRPNREN